MDEAVDLDRLDLGQRPGEPDLGGFVGNFESKGGVGRFGFGIEAGQQRRQGEARAERTCNERLGLLGPLMAFETRELAFDVGNDLLRQLLDASIVELVAHLRRTGVAAPEFAGQVHRIAADDLPQFTRARRKLAAGVVEAQAARQIIIAVRRALHHIRHRTEHPQKTNCVLWSLWRHNG